MAAEESTDRRLHTAHLDRADIEQMDDGSYTLPIVLEKDGQHIHVRIDPNDAARLHAQLDRLLNKGMAMTEYEKTAGYGGRYPVDHI